MVTTVRPWWVPILMWVTGLAIVAIVFFHIMGWMNMSNWSSHTVVCLFTGSAFFALLIARIRGKGSTVLVVIMALVFISLALPGPDRIYALVESADKSIQSLNEPKKPEPPVVKIGVETNFIAGQTYQIRNTNVWICVKDVNGDELQNGVDFTIRHRPSEEERDGIGKNDFTFLRNVMGGMFAACNKQ